MSKILVVDDEQDVCDILIYNLRKEGYEVETANSAEEAMRLPLPSFSLILLDVMMGEMSGFAMADSMRRRPETADVPIIFITAKDTDDDLVAGFAHGADDYIAKPFSLPEVISRVRAVLRRTIKSAPSSIEEEQGGLLKFAGIELDYEKKVLSVYGEEVSMAKKELEILHLLMSHPGSVFSRTKILDLVWPDESDVLDRAVDVSVTRLRKKLGPYGNHIVTRHGYGYAFDENV